MDTLPKGAILPWYNKAGEHVPSGWALCDGNNGTPDLNNRFLLGVNHSSDVGSQGGSPSHHHSQGKGTATGDGFESEGDHCRIVTISEESNIPPYVCVQFIMKL